MSKNVKIGNKLIVSICIVILIAIAAIIYKSNNELDFNTITKDTNNTTVTSNTINTVVESDVNVVE